jgi:hypothetical protein
MFLVHIHLISHRTRPATVSLDYTAGHGLVPDGRWEPRLQPALTVPDISGCTSHRNRCVPDGMAGTS